MNTHVISRRLAMLALAVSIGLIAGCHGRATIPSGAALMQSGRGGLSYTANRSGNAYVLDAEANEKVFEGHMNNGDQLVINPEQDRIVLGGNNAPHNVALKPDRKYEIYFTPD